MEAKEASPPDSGPFPRARRTAPRREPADRYLARGRSSASSWDHACTDCRDPLAWGTADHSHGVPLCLACARRRRTDPPPRDCIELAHRLDTIRRVIKDEVTTAMALLEGTPQEDDAKGWGPLILAALDSPGLGDGAVPRTMSATIAAVRRPIIHSGGNW